MMRWGWMVRGALVAAVLSCGCDAGEADSLEGPGFGGPPADPPPTGSKWQGVLVEGDCGRMSMAWILVDETCAGTSAPDYLDYFQAPMFRDGALIGDLLYAVDAAHLWVLDIGDAGQIQRRALVGGLGQPLAMATHAGRLVVAAGGEGLLVVNVDEPFAPVRVGQIAVPGPALDVHVVGDIAYVAAGEGIGMVDLAADPPVLLEHIDVPGWAAGVTVRDGLAYVAACESLIVVDLASASVLANEWIAEPYLNGILVAPAKDVELVGDVAFVAAGRYGAVALDVSEPLAPSVLGNCTISDDLGFYASGVRADGGRLFVAGGEWGILPLDVSDPLSTCSLPTEPEQLPAPPEEVECETDPPWEVLPWQDMWAPPPVGQDPIQTLPAGDRVYAFGDARRVALRAVDIRLAADPELTKIGRYDEPQWVTGVWAHAGRVLALGPGGGLFETDPQTLLSPALEPVPEAITGMAGGFLGDGRWVIATDDSVLLEGLEGPLTWTSGIWSHGMTTRGTEIILPFADGVEVVDPDAGTAVFLSAAESHLPLATAANADEIFLASPEWLQAYRATDGLPQPLPPHGVFDENDVLDANLWWAGLPRRALIPSELGLVEVATLGGVTGLAHHQPEVRTMLLPRGQYAGGVAQGDRIHLAVADRDLYRSQVVTVALDATTAPTIVGTHAFTGVAMGAALDGDRLYVADADRGIRVFDLTAELPLPLGLVDLEVTP